MESRPPGEPTTSDGVEAWIAEHALTRDRFAHIQRISHEHRAEHGCSIHPTSNGPYLGVQARAVGARRILEIGTGLGYSTLWLAFGAGPDAVVHTIERDPDHADIARFHAEREGYGDRIEIHTGAGAEVLETITDTYDLIFCDGDIEEYLIDLAHFFRLLSLGGLLITANLFEAKHSPDLPGLDQAAGYRERILTDERLMTAFAPGGIALSIRIA